MKTNKLYSGMILFIFFSLVPFVLLRAESEVQNITLQKQGEFTNVTIYANGPIQFNHFIEEKKDGKPYRVVIDCLNAVNSLPQKNFQDLPAGIISSIRTSQYQTMPDKVCRIVLDLKNSVIYKVVKGTGEKEITLAFSTPQEPVFQTWSAVQGQSALKDTKLAEANKTQKTEPIAQTTPLPNKEDKPIKTSVLKTDPVSKSATEKVEVAQKQVSPSKKSEVAPSVDKTVKPEKIVLAGTGVIPAARTESKPMEKAKTEEKSPVQIQKETKPAAPAGKPKAPEPEKPKIAKADTLKPVESDTLKKEAQAAMPGKIMEETPKREVLVYHNGQRKDPFSPLTEKKNFELGTVPLPTIEELKLVGILEDNSGYKALLENDLGYGYILQAGDRIRNGSVISVDKERVIFQIQEYGYTKNIALELYTPNQEER
ncbi:MAG TPA: AMIN domain-containing protein [Terriglobales bacterium]|nr:AMIN domain-containing protein [Terriglobales bacterium]